MTALVVPSPSDLPSLLTGDKVPECNRERFKRLQKTQWKCISPGSSWGDVSSLSEVEQLFSNGWDAGAVKARTESASFPVSDLTLEALVMRRRRVYRDAGDTVRVESALAGDWDRAFETRAKRQSSAPSALSICCAFGGAGVVSHDEFFWNGVQMIVLTDLLEGQGWRVELRAVKVNQYVDSTHVQDITVKSSDQPLRQDLAMALFGHAGVYRVYGWAGNLHSVFTVPHNLGRILVDDKLVKALGSASDAGLVHPASLVVPQAYNRDAVMQNIRAALARVKALASAA